MKNIVRSDRPTAVDQFIRQSLRSARLRANLGRGALTFGLALTLGAGSAMADEAAAPATDVQLLEEIVVTAQFREQNLQTTPVAITAVNGRALDERSMSSLTDLGAIAPNLTITKGTNTNGPSSQAFIRGIGQSDGHPGLEPGVGIYVDDVYHGLLLGSDLDLTDLDRVEVLRGPQGTLAGKNSIGGSIKLFSKKPSEETDGYAEATYGDFNRIDLRAGGNFTLVPDTLYARVSGTSKHSDGYMKRLDYFCATGANAAVTQIPVESGCKLGTEGGEDLHAARVALRWIASDSVENNLIGTVTADRSEVPALKLIYSNNTQTGPNGALVPGGGSQFITGPKSYTTYATFVNLGYNDGTIHPGLPGAGPHSAVSVPTTDPIDSYTVADTLDWKLADHYSLKLISGLVHYKGSYSIDVGGSPYTAQLLNDTFSERQYTEELRLNGTSFGQLDWTVGAYYYDEKALFGGLKMLSPGLATETLFTGNDPISSKNKSGFAHGVWRVTDALSAIGGIRYTKENKDYTFQRLNPYGTGPSYTAVGPLDGSTGTYSGNHTDYRAGVEYQWTESVMTYAQWSTGFRGGGVNPRPFIVQQEVPFKPENVHSSEIGVKSDFLDHHLRLNAAAFYSQYKDMLFTNTTPTLGAGGVVLSALNATPVNVGSADIKGAELEFEARPIGGLQIQGSVSYLNFKLTSLNLPSTVLQGVTLNTKEPYAPTRKADLGVQYVFTTPSWGSITPRVDADYTSSFFTDITNSPLGLVSGRTLMNARLSWKSAKEEWETALAVTNLTDRFYYINKVYAAAPTNITEGQPGAPREWLVSIRRNF
jgi:iron complex outermembrane recepter protein